MRKYIVRFTYLIGGETVEGTVNSEKLIKLIQAADQNQVVLHKIHPKSLDDLL